VRQAALLGALATCQMLGVGDLMLGEYRRGHVDGISPEPPAPILSVVAREATLGGDREAIEHKDGVAGAETQAQA
jgi:bifunctional ADP-heptose synthase (sugar kinase/adenylyltransferase)